MKLSFSIRFQARLHARVSIDVTARIRLSWVRLCPYSLIQRIISLKDILEIFILYGKRHILHFAHFLGTGIRITGAGGGGESFIVQCSSDKV